MQSFTIELLTSAIMELILYSTFTLNIISIV